MKMLHDLLFSSKFGSRFGAAFFTFWIAQRIYLNREAHFSLSIHALTFWIVTLQFGIFVVAYLTRHNAQEHANGFVEVFFPFICAAMPFALITDYPFRPVTRVIVALRPVSISLIISGTIVIIAGISYLRRSFSIMTEVREPVMKGIYRWTRHPMYIGSMITTLGALLQNWGWWNEILFVLFCCCQIYRANREEIKIMRIHASYRRYAAQVGWVWKVGRKKQAT